MYIDFTISLGLKILTSECDDEIVEILQKVTNISEEEIEILEDNGVSVSTKRLNSSIKGTYEGEHFLCIKKEVDGTSNFAFSLSLKEVKDWTKEIDSMKELCEKINIPFNENNLEIILDSNNY